MGAFVLETYACATGKGLNFGNFFKTFPGTALFVGSSLTVYLTATSKTITYLTTRSNSSWGKESTALL